MAGKLTPAQLAAHFAELYEATGECLIWTGTTQFGYGRVSVRTATGWTTKPVHRLVWEQEHGPIPEGQIVRHRCDNGSGGCIRLDHLELGTRSQNAADATERDRYSKHPAPRPHANPWTP